MKPSVYLAGPIKGLLYKDCVDWRNIVSKKLEPEIVAFSPMRGKEFLEGTKLIDTKDYTNPLATERGITCRDRMDVTHRDLIFFNFLGANSVSIGSMIEIGWADMLRKPIVMVMENDNIHSHKIVRGVGGIIVEDLDEGISIVKSMLLP